MGIFMILVGDMKLKSLCLDSFLLQMFVKIFAAYFPPLFPVRMTVHILIPFIFCSKVLY